MKFHFLYATETGSSEMLCEDMEAELDGTFECEIGNVGEFAPSDLNGETFYVFVVSTYGNGDLPSTALPFWDALEAEKPDLNHVRFAIFGLGDMVFDETFNNGSKQIMEKLQAFGAKMHGERGLYDASSTMPPEDTGLPWLHGVIAQLTEEAA